jgi:hypothetical protein
MVLTDKGRRALWFDRLGLPLPASYSAWGSADSPYCLSGHRHSRRGQCAACAQVGLIRKAAA